MDWKEQAFALKAEGIKSKDIAERLGKHPSQISRLFNAPAIPTSTPVIQTRDEGLGQPIFPPSQQLQAIREKYAPKQPAEVGALLKNDTLLVVVAVTTALVVSAIVTAPIIIGAIPRTDKWLAYLLAALIDIMPLLFVLRGRHALGGAFAIATGLQVAIACNVFDPVSWVECVKGIIISLSVALAIFGLADVIKNTKKAAN